MSSVPWPKLQQQAAVVRAEDCRKHASANINISELHLLSRYALQEGCSL